MLHATFDLVSFALLACLDHILLFDMLATSRKERENECESGSESKRDSVCDWRLPLDVPQLLMS